MKTTTKTLLLALIAAATIASSSDHLLLKLKKRLCHINTITGEFTQQVVFADGKKRTLHGRFYIKDNKSRWEYKGDEEQIVITKGKEVYIYDPFSQQVQQGRLDFPAIYSNIFKDPSSLKEFFQVKAKDNLLELTPKKETQIKRVVIVLDKNLNVRGITILDNMHNLTRLEFSSVRYNIPLDDRLFSLEGLKRDAR